jgi:hypothetical protein
MNLIITFKIKIINRFLASCWLVAFLASCFLASGWIVRAGVHPSFWGKPVGLHILGLTSVHFLITFQPPNSTDEVIYKVFL